MYVYTNIPPFEFLIFEHFDFQKKKKWSVMFLVSLDILVCRVTNKKTNNNNNKRY